MKLDLSIVQQCFDSVAIISIMVRTQKRDSVAIVIMGLDVTLRCIPNREQKFVNLYQKRNALKP